VRVLIAEDDVRLATLLSQVLDEEGWTSTHCADGGTALAEARSGVHDVVLLDWGLPVVDGTEVLRRLRREGNPIPVLLLTARGTVRDRVVGLDTGADDYLAKPFDIDELLARLRALHRRSTATVGEHLRVGDLDTNLATRTATRQGRLLELTTRELDLLVLLTGRAGQVVSRQTILEHLWDGDTDLRSNIVDVYIGNLRAKVDRPFTQPCIRTVRGLGYRIEPRDPPS
jgi:DNA-binding response OmpR family regulator